MIGASPFLHTPRSDLNDGAIALYVDYRARNSSGGRPLRGNDGTFCRCSKSRFLSIPPCLISRTGVVPFLLSISKRDSGNWPFLPFWLVASVDYHGNACEDLVSEISTCARLLFDKLHIGSTLIAFVTRSFYWNGKRELRSFGSLAGPVGSLVAS